MSVVTGHATPGAAAHQRGSTSGFRAAARLGSNPMSPSFNDRDSNSPPSSAWDSGKSCSDISENEDTQDLSAGASRPRLSHAAHTNTSKPRSFSYDNSPRNSRDAKRARVEEIVASMRPTSNLVRSAPNSPTESMMDGVKRRRTMATGQTNDGTQKAPEETNVDHSNGEKVHKSSEANVCVGEEKLSAMTQGEHPIGIFDENDSLPRTMISSLSPEEAMFVAAFKREVANAVKVAAEASALRILKSLGADGIFARYKDVKYGDHPYHDQQTNDECIKGNSEAYHAARREIRDRRSLQNEPHDSNRSRENQGKNVGEEDLSPRRKVSFGEERKDARDHESPSPASAHSGGFVASNLTQTHEEERRPERVDRRHLDSRSSASRNSSTLASPEVQKHGPTPTTPLFSGLNPFFHYASTLRNFHAGLTSLPPFSVAGPVLGSPPPRAPPMSPKAGAPRFFDNGRTTAFHQPDNRASYPESRPTVRNGPHDSVLQRLQFNHQPPLVCPFPTMPFPPPLRLHPSTLSTFDYQTLKYGLKQAEYGRNLKGSQMDDRTDLQDCLVTPHLKEGLDQDMDSSRYVFPGNAHEGLTPQHLKKAKLIFFYTRYPSANTLKTHFPDVKFTRAITSQIIKWFSNFREFFYIQMEKFARQIVAKGVSDPSTILVSRDSELFRVLNLHYNKSNDFQVPESFIHATEASLREFFVAVRDGKDYDPAWKKVIYKVICKLDSEIPELFKSTSVLENLQEIHN